MQQLILNELTTQRAKLQELLGTCTEPLAAKRIVTDIGKLSVELSYVERGIYTSPQAKKIHSRLAQEEKRLSTEARIEAKRAAKEAAETEVAELTEEALSTAEQLKAASRAHAANTAVTLIDSQRYYFIQRHNCYYKKNGYNRLDDVAISSLPLAHPELQDKLTRSSFDHRMVEEERVFHDITYSWRPQPDGVLNLLDTYKLTPTAPTAEFRQDYFDLLVKTAAGEYEENIEHIERWISWKYLHPEDYSLPALVLFKSGGAGKNLLMEAVMRIVWGTDKVCKVEGDDFFDKFNDDQLGTAIVFIDEMDFAKTNINKLKSRVQSSTWKVNGKFKRRWAVDTTMGFVLATQDARGGVKLNKDNVDRRWSILKAKRSLVSAFNEQFHENRLSEQEVKSAWEHIAETVIKDEKQVAMWLHWLLAKQAHQTAPPTALHGQDYRSVVLAQRSYLDDVFERVFLLSTFKSISLDTLYTIANILHKDLHMGSYKMASGTILVHMLDEIKAHGLPITFDPKKAYYGPMRTARSKSWFHLDALTGTTLDDTSAEWISHFHEDSPSMLVDIDRFARTHQQR